MIHKAGPGGVGANSNLQFSRKSMILALAIFGLILISGLIFSSWSHRQIPKSGFVIESCESAPRTLMDAQALLLTPLERGERSTQRR